MAPRRHAGAADAVEAVAAGDEVAGELVRLAVLLVGDARPRPVEVVHRDVGGLVHGGQAGRAARLHQVARQLGLAVDHDGLAAGQAVQVDAVATAAPQHLEAVVHQALAVHPRRRRRASSSRSTQTCSSTPARMRPSTCSPVWRSRITVSMPGLGQKLAEQQPRRAGPDDGDLSPARRGHRAASPRARRRVRRFHPVAPLRVRRRRRGQEADQCPRGFGLARGRADRHRERGDDLDRPRQRPEHVDPLERGELRELLKAELHPAARHEGADGNAGGRRHDPIPELGRDAPALEQPAERDAARPGRRADGARGQHCPADRVLVADVGSPGSRAHGDRDGRVREIHCAAGREVAGRDQLLDGLARERHDVERLAGLHALGRPRRHRRDSSATGWPVRASKARVRSVSTGFVAIDEMADTGTPRSSGVGKGARSLLSGTLIWYMKADVTVPSPRSFEDFTVGLRFRSPSAMPVAAEGIKAFAAEFDPQPPHLDEEAARRTSFRGWSPAVGTPPP